MARPRKNTIDYFPHDVHHRKTLKIIEHEYGIAGYGFWFKLLEFLGKTPEHFYYIQDDICLKFLASETLCDEGFCYKILGLLARLDAIDRELWSKKVIWSQNFINRISDAYAGRINDIPQKPDANKFLAPETPFIDPETPFLDLYPPGNPQSKVKERKVNKREHSAEKKHPLHDPVDNFDDNLFEDHIPADKMKSGNPGPTPADPKPRRSIAIIRYRELTGVRPNKVQIDLIDANVSESNLEPWVNVIKGWLGHNWNKTNVSGMLDCMNNGGVHNGRKPTRPVEQKLNNPEIEKCRANIVKGDGNYLVCKQWNGGCQFAHTPECNIDNPEFCALLNSGKVYRISSETN